MTQRHHEHPIPADCWGPEHLGDGAYVSHDSFQIWVSADRDGRLEAIALDGFAIENLVKYAKAKGMIR